MIERIIVAGGGTGGHLFPGLAVVEELRRRVPGLDVLFVGTARGIEARVLPGLGERLELLEVSPLAGRGAAELARGFWLLPGALRRAVSLVRRERPDLVIGVGGYASGPVLAAAASLGVPTAVLEQNAEVGLTNRLLAPCVGRAYVSFPETAARFAPRRVRVSGNPVRRAFVSAARGAAADPDGFEARCRTVLVLGGSQGARSLNESVPAGLAQAGLGGQGWRVVHQTGQAMCEAVRTRYRELGLEAEVVPFLDDMARAYASAAVVIARAGATTVAELCAVGRPALLVPYPHAAHDHQRRNAEVLAQGGAAVCVPDPELEPARVAAEVRSLLGDSARRRAMGEAARRLGRPDAAASIVDDLCEWLGCPPRAATAAGAEEAPAPESGDGTPGEESKPGGGGSRFDRVGGLRGSSPYFPRPSYPPVFACSPAGPCARAPRRPLLAHPSLLE